MTRFLALALLLVACGSESPPAPSPIDATPDNSMTDVAEASSIDTMTADVFAPEVGADASDAPAPNLARCLGSCATHADCASVCRISERDTNTYCCVRGLCTSGSVSCDLVRPISERCDPGAWTPVCVRDADCVAACGSEWTCRSVSVGVARCEQVTDAGVRDAGNHDVVDASCMADVANDPNHCGACGRACRPGGAHTIASCRQGTCRVTCESDAWWDCNNDPADGCEATDTYRRLCGSCTCRSSL